MAVPYSSLARTIKPEIHLLCILAFCWKNVFCFIPDINCLQIYCDFKAPFVTHDYGSIAVISPRRAPGGP